MIDKLKLFSVCLAAICLAGVCRGGTLAARSGVDFSLKLLEHSLAEHGKEPVWCVSGFGVMDNLAFIYAGASGDTAREIKAVFSIREAPAEFLTHNQQLNKELAGRNPGRLETANLIALNRAAGDFNPEYRALLRKQYRVSMQLIDLTDKAGTLSRINS